MNEPEEKDPMTRESDLLAAAAASSSASLETQSDNLERAQRRIQGYEKIGERDNLKDKTGALLSELLNALPEDGRSNLAADIVAREQDSELRNLAVDLRTFVFGPLRAVGGKTPASSRTPSEYSFSDDVQPKSRSAQSQLKSLCLRRDRNRCVLSGAYDARNAELPEEEVRTCGTECAHIVASAFGPASEGEVSADQMQRLARTWAFLYRYFPAVQAALDIRSPDANALHSPTNALTLVPPLHTEFGSFNLSFEQIEASLTHATKHPILTNMPQGRRNTYRIKRFPKFATLYTFMLPDNDECRFGSAVDSIAPPDPRLLALHLAIATVLHASGIAGEVDDAVEDIEGQEGCLDVDGMTELEDVVWRWLLRVG